MKILTAVDENLYSMYALGEVARLAANTWPDMTLLAVEDGSRAPADADNPPPQEAIHPKIKTLRTYRADFMAMHDAFPALYAGPEGRDFEQPDKNLLEDAWTDGRKEFRLRLRSGNPAKSILAEAREAGSDMVVLGCGQGVCGWGSHGQVPGKVAESADCPVLVVKEAKRPDKVTCCLDHAHVSQQSLEMINQLVTLYGVDLEIAGVLKHGELREDVERTMGQVLDYYLERDVRALVKVVDADALESFIAMGARTDLMALWLGHKSALARLFPGSKIAALVNSALSSVLILR